MEVNRSGASSAAAILIPLIPAALFYALLLVGLTELYGTNFSAGGGEARLEAALLSLWLIGSGAMLWLMLGIPVWFTRNAVSRPTWARRALLPLYLLSGLAATFAIATMFDDVGGWSGLVPVLLPPLFSLHAVWAGLPALGRRLEPEVVSGGLLGTIAVLIVAAIPLAAIDSYEAPRNAARLEARRDAVRAEQAAELQKEIAEDKVRYQNLGVDSPLWAYLRYAGRDDEEEMISRMRLVKSRQPDAVALLNDGRVGRLTFLWRLDLAPTPELCAAYDAALRKMVDAQMPASMVWYRNVVDQLEQQIPNMKWLTAGGCNLNGGLAAAEAPIRSFIEHKTQVEPDLPRWQEFLATTRALRLP